MQLPVTLVEASEWDVVEVDSPDELPQRARTVEVRVLRLESGQEGAYDGAVSWEEQVGKR